MNFPDEDDQNRNTIMNKLDVQAFIILDPFDWTSNYGKPHTIT